MDEGKWAVNITDKGDREGIYKVGLGTGEKNLRRGDNDGGLGWGQKEKCPLLDKVFYSGVKQMLWK